MKSNKSLSALFVLTFMLVLSACNQQNTELSSTLEMKDGYDLPFGSAEVMGYYTTVERSPSIDDSEPKVTCSAFVVTDGPEMLLEALKANKFVGDSMTVVIGEKEDPAWGNLVESTEDEQVKASVTLNPEFEGEVVGCMTWPLESITVVEE